MLFHFFKLNFSILPLWDAGVDNLSIFMVLSMLLQWISRFQQLLIAKFENVKIYKHNVLNIKYLKVKMSKFINIMYKIFH